MHADPNGIAWMIAGGDRPTRHPRRLDPRRVRSIRECADRLRPTRPSAPASAASYASA